MVYDKKDKIFYVFDKKTNEKFSTFASWIKFLKNKKLFSGERSALATIFFEPNSSSFNLASLLRTKQIPYWKNYNSTSIAEVTSLIKTLMTSNQKYSSLNQMFITILKSSTDVELGDEECGFIYERCITIYMRSRQKTWRNVNNYIPEKGTASLREGLKTTRSNNSATENKTSSLMKKANLPTNPIYALEQLRVWAQLEKAEDSFAKIFSVSELLWIIWAFGSSTSYKRKQKLVPIIISNLKNSTPFTEEALKRRSIFMEQIE